MLQYIINQTIKGNLKFYNITKLNYNSINPYILKKQLSNL